MIAKQGPDAVCHELKICTDSTCKLFSGATSSPLARFAAAASDAPAASHEVHRQLLSSSSRLSPQQQQQQQPADFDPWQWLKDLINKLGNDHLPIYDIDGDDFSGTLQSPEWSRAVCVRVCVGVCMYVSLSVGKDLRIPLRLAFSHYEPLSLCYPRSPLFMWECWTDSETLRGGNWRGRDCNDFLNNVYPGRNDSTGLSVCTRPPRGELCGSLLCLMHRCPSICQEAKMVPLLPSRMIADR